MTIKAYRNLSESLTQEVLNLESKCLDHDNLKGSLFLDSSLNFGQDIHSAFLFYEKGQLISMLSMFIPTKREAEISAYTLPKYRRKGYFQALLRRAVDELRKFEIPDLLFVCEAPSTSGKRVLKALKAEYEHTEYFMRFAPSSYCAMGKSRLVLSKAEPEDFEDAVATSMKVFDDNYEDAKELLSKCFQSDTREQYLAMFKGELIGIGSANLEEEDVSIFGLGLIPEYRGQGYGKELLRLIMDDLWQRGRKNITIEVNSENISALKLYEKTGFQIEVAYEYYRKKAADLYV